MDSLPVYNVTILCCVQIMEWTRYSLQMLQVRLNAFVKLMLFHNIKRSLKVHVTHMMLYNYA